jgi:alpha-L-fucosidase 2
MNYWPTEVCNQLNSENKRADVHNYQGGTYPNLFDSGPPFQIDGNMSGSAGAAEMLFRSHAGEIDFLPALPKAWPKDKVKGLCARSGFEVDMEWESGQLLTATVHSKLGNSCRIRVQAPAMVTSDEEATMTSNPVQNAFEFKTLPGKSYVISRAK